MGVWDKIKERQKAFYLELSFWDGHVVGGNILKAHVIAAQERV